MLMVHYTHTILFLDLFIIAYNYYSQYTLHTLQKNKNINDNYSYWNNISQTLFSGDLNKL